MLMSNVPQKCRYSKYLNIWVNILNYFHASSQLQLLKMLFLPEEKCSTLTSDVYSLPVCDQSIQILQEMTYGYIIAPQIMTLCYIISLESKRAASCLKSAADDSFLSENCLKQLITTL